jgi:hypothetical protein
MEVELYSKWACFMYMLFVVHSHHVYFIPEMCADVILELPTVPDIFIAFHIEEMQELCFKMN